MGNKPLNLPRLPFRGGNWNNTTNAGLPALNLNNPRSNSNSNIGFRAALTLQPEGAAHKCARPVQGKKGFISLPTIILVAKKIVLPRKQ
jgi:RNA-directed DNA polymerase